MRPPRSAAAVLCALALCAGAAGQDRFRKSPPLADPLPELRLPPIESAVLSNGLTVAVVRRPAAPRICLRLVILAGEADSPPKIPGVASVTAHLIGRGADLMTPAEIEGRIEALGAEIEADVSLERTVFAFDVLEEDLDRALELLGAVLIRATFAERTVEGVKRTLTYDLSERQRDVEFVAKRQLLRHLFRGHPFRTATYNEDVVKDVARGDVAAFYERYYRPNNAVLVVAGDMTLQAASRLVSHHFNTWQSRKLERSYLPPPEPNREPLVSFVDIPQAPEATLFVGNVIPGPIGPDHFPFAVLNQALGGTPGSRLFMNLRESKGYAYYAFSGADLHRTCGVFWVRARLSAEAIVPSIREVLREIAPRDIERMTSVEIEQAKSFLVGSFPLRNEVLGDLASRAALVRGFELGDDHWGRFTQNIILVTPERVLDTARRALEPPPVVVIAGDIRLLAEHVRDLDRIDVHDVRGNLKWTINKGVER